MHAQRAIAGLNARTQTNNGAPINHLPASRAASGTRKKWQSA
jgi:hypothetical protein